MFIAAFALARREPALLALLATASLFGMFHGTWLGDLSNPVWAGFLFAWLFAIVVWGATGLVGHAERLATLTGEPYGTLILTL
jgi:Ca2+:H+ antiporter